MIHRNAAGPHRIIDDGVAVEHGLNSSTIRGVASRPAGDAEAAVAEIVIHAKGRKPGGLSIRELRDEGRRG